MVVAVKNPPANAGNIRDGGSIPGLGRAPGEGNGYPLQYSWLENPMDRGAWKATVHRVIKSQTWLERLAATMKVSQSCLTLCSPMDYTVHGILQNTRVGSLSLLQGNLLSEYKPRSPALLVDSLPAEPQGKPKNTGILGSLTLLQQIFQTQESNWDLLHFRQILYQLSYQGSPEVT